MTLINLEFITCFKRKLGKQCALNQSRNFLFICFLLSLFICLHGEKAQGEYNSVEEEKPLKTDGPLIYIVVVVN